MYTSFSEDRKSIVRDYIQILPCHNAKDTFSALCQRVKMLLGQGTDGEMDGIVNEWLAIRQSDAYGSMGVISPHAFRYDDASMWRGWPSNPDLIKVSQSMIVAGFNNSHPIKTRSSDFSDIDDSGEA